jgi:CRP-like cAMP-binding protein
VVSIVCEFADGTVAEMASVGREGVIGAGALSDGDAAIARYEVQFSGRALAIDEGFFRKAAQTHPGLRAVCFEYLQAFHGQVLQSVACNSVHSLEERYARWLLTTHDRLPGDTFPLTQEILAGVLGVHRPTVSLAARKLQNAGLIRYNRGEITLLDREGLENVACDCYRIICDHYERRLPAAYCQPAASEK